MYTIFKIPYPRGRYSTHPRISGSSNSRLNKNQMPTTIKQIFRPTPRQRGRKNIGPIIPYVSRCVCSEWENKTGQAKLYCIGGERDTAEEGRKEGRKASSQPKIIQRAACSFWPRSSVVGRYKHHPLLPSLPFSLSPSLLPLLLLHWLGLVTASLC